MHATAVARIEPTDAQLREAWTSLARRFHWSGTFDDAMNDTVRSRLVRMSALHPPCAAATPATATPPARPHPTPTPAPRFHTEPLPFGFIDNKRRAAGERDDD